MQKYIYYLLLSFTFWRCDSEGPIIVPQPKIDYYVESYDIPGLGFEPQLKVTYEYNSSGKLSRYNVITYNPDSKSFEEQRYFDFTYTDNKVNKIIGSLPDATNPYLEYAYEYFPDGRVSKIKETNVNAGVNSEASFAYDDANQSTKVSYTFSNGGSFEYEFHVTKGNVVTDKTTRGAQLCSDGQYIYDDHVNPFSKLGYTDYLLTNLSANNKVTENINHVNCSFPSFIPESYSYEYNDLDYPTLITTSYKSGSTVARSQKEIFYK
jgi:hypothetical protein